MINVDNKLSGTTSTFLFMQNRQVKNILKSKDLVVISTQ